MDKILKWKCPECGKEIKSIYSTQFEYNKKQHIESHKEVTNNETLQKKD